MAEAALRVAVYADESCLGNGREGSNPGGAAGLIQLFRGGELTAQRDYWLSEPATTNNRMALRSGIEAFRILSAKGQRLAVFFTSDSRYLVDGMTQWTRDWSRRGWKRKGGAIENLDLWRELCDAASAHTTGWRWVRGHDVHIQNGYADFLATRAARTQTGSGGAVPSGFDEWLAAERGRGRADGIPDAAPDAARFTAGCALPPAPAARLL